MQVLIIIAKFLLNLLLFFVPPQVLAQYLTEKKRVIKVRDKFKATLNKNPTLANTQIDDYALDKIAEAIARLGEALRKPDSRQIKWINEKTEILEKLTK